MACVLSVAVSTLQRADGTDELAAVVVRGL
jgi:hypothetical protein